MADVPHEYGPSRVGHGEAQCKWCHGTNRENAIISPNHCEERAKAQPATLSSNERLARLQTLAASSIVGDDLRWLLAQYESLVSVATPIAEALRQVGDESNWRDGDETDRVYAWHEIEPLWKALTGASRKPGCLRPVCAEEPGYCRRCSPHETVSLSTYESAVKGRADFREAYRNARYLVYRFIASWESQPGHENMDRLCAIGRSLGTVGDDSAVSPANARFIECDTCRAKPGSPTLCAGCLHNRHVIEALTGRMTQARHPIETKALRRPGCIVISGFQLKHALDFVDQDDESELVIEHVDHERPDGNSSTGEMMPAGLYAWFNEYPDEGALLLLESPPKTRAEPAKCLVADCPESTADGQAMCAEHMQRIEP